MNRRIALSLAAAGALLLAACGGGGDPVPTRTTVDSVNHHSRAPSSPPAGGFGNVVAFGDSLSDAGTYTVAAYLYYHRKLSPPPAFDYPFGYGGQFTVNGPQRANWTQVLARGMGLRINPNLIGYDIGVGKVYALPGGAFTTDQAQASCAFDTAAAGSAPDCTNFAQGGARIAEARGIGSDQGALTFPLTEQLANYLQQFGGFQPQQLVTVLAGSNDVFAALQQVHDARPEDRAAAARQAQAAVGAAADQLAGAVSSMLRKGARHLLVYTLPDAALTPFGRSLDGSGHCDRTDPRTACYLLSNLVQVFNQRLLDDLDGQPIKMIDGYALLEQEIAHPQGYGFDRVDAPWCDPAATEGSSLLCNSATPNSPQGASASNLDSWLFADTLHPTPAGHRVIAQQTLQAMRSFGWLS